MKDDLAIPFWSTAQHAAMTSAMTLALVKLNALARKKLLSRDLTSEAVARRMNVSPNWLKRFVDGHDMGFPWITEMLLALEES